MLEPVARIWEAPERARAAAPIITLNEVLRIKAMKILDEQVAIVTGAGRGIGEAIAIELARHGARIALGVRDRESGNRVQALIAGGGGEATVFICDVSSAETVRETVAGVVEQLGAVNILINNAGVIEPIGLITDTEFEDWRRSIDINLVGSYNFIRCCLPHMLELGGGSIINISSGAASTAIEGWSAYCAGKAGLAMLARSTHLEYGERGIRVIGLSPGMVDTRMQGEIRASGINPVSKVPKADLRSPLVPAAAAAWLCGPDAADWGGREVGVSDEDLIEAAGLAEIGSG